MHRWTVLRARRGLQNLAPRGPTQRWTVDSSLNLHFSGTWLGRSLRSFDTVCPSFSSPFSTLPPPPQRVSPLLAADLPQAAAEEARRQAEVPETSTWKRGHASLLPVPDTPRDCQWTAAPDRPGTTTPGLIGIYWQSRGSCLGVVFLGVQAKR